MGGENARNDSGEVNRGKTSCIGADSYGGTLLYVLFGTLKMQFRKGGKYNANKRMDGKI